MLPRLQNRVQDTFSLTTEFTQIRRNCPQESCGKQQFPMDISPEHFSVRYQSCARNALTVAHFLNSSPRRERPQAKSGNKNIVSFHFFVKVKLLN
jgi:O-acetylhomoserine/O-acetylserine sulfhydrylase-like pyridoxal-dependent enzyme